MYKLVRLVVVASIMSLVWPASANAATLVNGLYHDPTGDWCDIQIQNDMQSGNVLMIGTHQGSKDCLFYDGSTLVPSAVLGEFASTDDPKAPTVVDKSFLEFCQPKKSDWFPCGSEYYDAQTGRLLIEIGDRVVTTIYSKMLNPNALEWNISNDTRYYRNGALIVTEKDTKPATAFFVH